MAGAVVTVGSPSLQGIRTETTDIRGEFRFAFLPPGIYDVKAGDQASRRPRIQGVRVDLDRIATVQLVFQIAAVLETVQVSGGLPAIDVTNTTTGLNVTAELYSRVPLDRSFFAIARVAPGTQEDEVGTASSRLHRSREPVHRRRPQRHRHHRGRPRRQGSEL